MVKRIGYGSKIFAATTTGGTTSIGQVRSITGPIGTGDAVETTTLDSSSNFRTYVQGLTDPGEITLDIVLDSTSESYERLVHYRKERIAVNYTVKFGSSTGDGFTSSCFVTSLGPTIPLDDVITAEATLKVSGIPGFSTA